MKRRAVWPVLLAALAGLAILLSLGVWQVNRLAWKNALLADMAASMAGPPAMLDLNTMANAPAIAEMQKFKLSGHYADVPPFRMIATLNGGPGWRLLHLFEADAGFRVIVDRGIAPENVLPPAPTGTVEVVGLVRHHMAGQGIFDPANDVTNNHWYWWDWASMLGTLPPSATPTGSFALTLLPDQPGSAGMFVEVPKASLANNHLGYAITWFGLAAVLAVMTVIFLASLARRPLEVPPPQD